MHLETLGATWGVERRRLSRSWELDQVGAWFVEEPYDVASKDIIGWFLDFTTSPETTKGVVPDGRLQKVGGRIGSEHNKHRP